jgi:hypothetical protein
VLGISVCKNISKNGAVFNRGKQMARLKCLNCGSIFDKKALVTYAGVGATGAGAGVGWGPIIWPLALRIYAECPCINKRAGSKSSAHGAKARAFVRLRVLRKRKERV